MMKLLQKLRVWWREQHASQGLEAAGVALAAAIIIVALLSMAPTVGERVEQALTCAASVLSGGGGACGGGAAATGGEAPAGGAAPTVGEAPQEEGCDGFLCQVGGFFKGLGEGAVDFVVGIGTLVVDGVKLAFGDEETQAKYQALIDAFQRDPGGTLWALGGAILEPIAEDWRAGRYGEAIGRGIFEVGSIFIGDKGIGKLGKLGKLDDLARVASRGDDIGDVGRVLDRIPCVSVAPSGKAPGLAAPLRGCIPLSGQALQRAQRLLDGAPGYNVSPESWFGRYPTLGRGRTFVTDEQAITDVLGRLDIQDGVATVTPDQVSALERALGLTPGSLADGFRITRIDNIVGRAPGSPIVGNEYFLGGGRGLPGGGPELTIDPIPTRGGPGIQQIIIRIRGR